MQARVNEAQNFRGEELQMAEDFAAEHTVQAADAALPDTNGAAETQVFTITCAKCGALVQARLAEGATTVQCIKCSGVFVCKVTRASPEREPRAPREPAAARPSELPPGWEVEERVSSTGKSRYKRFTGPDGVSVQSLPAAWRVHNGTQDAPSRKRERPAGGETADAPPSQESDDDALSGSFTGEEVEPGDGESSEIVASDDRASYAAVPGTD